MTESKVVQLHPEEPNEPGPNWSGPPPKPKLTETQAVKRGKFVDRKTFRFVDLLFGLVVAHHIAARTPRNQWEPTPTITQRLSAPYIKEGQDVVDDRLETDVDPELDKIDDAVEEIKANVEILEKGPGDVTSPETKKPFSAADGVTRAKQDADQIERDRAAGARIHERVPKWLRIAGEAAPFADALGLLSFATFEFNVPLLAPWVNLLSWTLCVVIVVVISVALKVSVDRAARHHNQARESDFYGQNHEAEASRKHRLGWGLAAGLIALAITAGMLERAVVALTAARPLAALTLAALAVLTGIACPVVAFAATAFDGSKVRRQHDALVDQLDDDRDEWDDDIATIEEETAQVEQTAGGITTRILPSIRVEAEAKANEARPVFNFLRLQLGLPEGDAPAGGLRLLWGHDGKPRSGSISNGLPGSDEISLQGFVDRWVHLESKRAELKALLDRVAQLPPHPWDKAQSDQ